MELVLKTDQSISLVSELKLQFIAELVHIQNDEKLAKEFYDKYSNDKLEGGVRKRSIDKLLKSKFTLLIL
jgi:hypothetical protein